VLGVPSEAVALLATLMLRGPQTAAELRANCERIHRFSDVSATEAYLEELAARAPQPYVARLARQPGSRESRWTHLLAGGPHEEAVPAGAPPRHETPRVDLDALVGRIERLEAEVAALRARVDGAV
jgi:hypothetical protein